MALSPVGETIVTITAGGAITEKLAVHAVDDTLAAADEPILGIAKATAASGAACAVSIAGIAVATSGAAITKGAKVKANASAKLIPVAANGDDYIGYARTAASGADEDFLVLIDRGTAHA